jgi:hypothetical protein
VGARTEKKNDGVSTKDIRTIFGRVVACRDVEGGAPSLQTRGGKFLEIIPILEELLRGTPAGKIQQKFRISEGDVLLCKSYLHRFGADSQKPQGIPLGPKGFVLDENSPHILLPEVSELFGWSTHVRAEGLSGKGTSDREKIWPFVTTHGFSALVTRDRDFLAISRQAFEAASGKQHGPGVILVDGLDGREDYLAYLSRYQSHIRHFLSEKTAPYCVLRQGDGFMVPDSGTRFSYNRSCAASEPEVGYS